MAQQSKTFPIGRNKGTDRLETVKNAQSHPTKAIVERMPTRDTETPSKVNKTGADAGRSDPSRTTERI